MSAAYPDAPEVLLCQDGSEACVRNWCRRLLLTDGFPRPISITLLRWRGLPRQEWHTERVFSPPFSELLTRPQRTKGASLRMASRRDLGRARQPVAGVLASAGTPFSEPVLAPIAPADPEQTVRHERLLAWLSATGAGPWPTFRDVCRTLGLALDVGQAARIQRRLVLLGHLEVSQDGGRWAVRPPTVVALADDPHSGFLCGQRTRSLLDLLPPGQQETHQVDASAPQRVSLPLHDEEAANPGGGTLPRFARGQVASATAQALPGWQDWLRELPDLRGLVLTDFSTKERWVGAQWVQVSGTLFEDEARRIRGESGMYRLSKREPYPWTVCVYFDAANQRFVRGDWYGLRFLARRFSELPMTARWSEGQRVLCIPSEERWPLFYERVAVQASGLLPRLATSGDLCYPHVPEDLALTLCQKLGIELRVGRHNKPDPQLLLA